MLWDGGKYLRKSGLGLMSCKFRTCSIQMILLCMSFFAPNYALSSNCLVPKLEQEMSYDKAREIIIGSGFQAPALPAYGYKEDDEKVTSDCFGDVELCNRFPEIEGCSGQGHCRMSFTDA